MDKYILVIFLMLCSCAPIGHTAKFSIDPDLVQHYTRFMTEAINRNVMVDLSQGITVMLTDELTGYTIGRCNKGSKMPPVVLIRRDYWYASSDATKEQLMYHELGHCALNRGHDNSLVLDQNETIPKSIMTEWNFIDSIYISHHEYFMVELFGR